MLVFPSNINGCHVILTGKEHHLYIALKFNTFTYYNEMRGQTHMVLYICFGVIAFQYGHHMFKSKLTG